MGARFDVRCMLKLVLAVLLACSFVPMAAWASDKGSSSAETVSSSSSSSSGSEETSPKPDKPAEPDKPDKPKESDEPAKPDKPDKPDEPDKPDKPDEPDEPDEPEREYVDVLLLQWDKPDERDQRHFVGDNPIVEESYRELSITKFGESVQLNGWYLSTDGTGVARQAADASTKIGSFDLAWKSSDEKIATVSPSGLVTPKGANGKVKITATVVDQDVYKGTAPSAVVSIVFDGQEGKYVEKVEILNESGDAIGESWGGVTVYNEQNTFHQLQARITWHYVATGATETEVTGAGDVYDAKAVGTTLTWNMSGNGKSDEAPFYVNPDTGRLKTGQYAGSAYVTCTAVGGLGGKEVTDTANVQLDTGVYRYDPADSLTLKVVWEERPDEVVKEVTYSYDELLGKLPSRKVNATVVNGKKYGVISAEGWLFKDVVQLVAVEDADVMQYRFITSDGYDNPVSYQYLFDSGNRYYFPNYDVGSIGEGSVVPPVLAYKSAFVWNVSEANPNIALDDGTRFRLVFGCLGSGDANTSFQIYYIRGITVVLKGGPSAGGNGGNGGGNGNGGGAGGTGDGGGGSGGGKNGSSNKGGTGTGGGKQPGPFEGNDGNGEELAGAEAAAGGGDDLSQGEMTQPAEQEAAEGSDLGSSKRWRVYQMMNKTNSDVPDWDDENPLSPFALPVAAGAFAVGASATSVGFRRRLK